MKDTVQPEEIDLRLADALRCSEITAADAEAVELLAAVAGGRGTYRIASAMRAIRAWLRAKEAQS